MLGLQHLMGRRHANQRSLRAIHATILELPNPIPPRICADWLACASIGWRAIPPLGIDLGRSLVFVVGGGLRGAGTRIVSIM